MQKYLQISPHIVNTSSKKILTVEIMRDSRAIKRQELFAGNILKMFAPKNLKFQPAEYTKYDTGIVVNLPKNVKRCYCSINKQFIKVSSGNKCIYLGLLNNYFTK